MSKSYTKKKIASDQLDFCLLNHAALLRIIQFETHHYQLNISSRIRNNQNTTNREYVSHQKSIPPQTDRSLETRLFAVTGGMNARFPGFDSIAIC